MNAKTAKRIRKEAMYHPSQPRQYDGVKRQVNKNTVITFGRRMPLTLADHDPRSLYKELKREEREG